MSFVAHWHLAFPHCPSNSHAITMKLGILTQLLFLVLGCSAVNSADVPPADRFESFFKEADESLRAKLRLLPPIRTQRTVVGTGASSSHTSVPPAELIKARLHTTRARQKSEAQRKLSFDPPSEDRVKKDTLNL
ncbi:uncharacterized protein UBRO_20735 [Ustilago bromivora]|uniref:Uncharacterized protein n=2 Tax=Ustilago bromivora TaxID=307758 RepID=A0A1K0H617_9BASI|nr:uncharacterized protein UBRO_20735 [Ustilago bromivora]